MLISIVCALVSVILLTFVFFFGVFVGYKATIETLKMKGDISEGWPSQIIGEEGSDDLYVCEGCNAPSDVIHCTNKGKEYYLCHECMEMLGAKPLE
jgi:hypothetical protein